MQKVKSIIIIPQFISVFIVCVGTFLYLLCDRLNINSEPLIMSFRIENFYLLLFGAILLPIIFSKNNDESKKLLKHLVYGLILCFVIINFGHIFRKLIGNVFHPRQWDFFDFYITGKIAATGANIYSPDLFQSVLLPVPPREDFINEVLMVGSKYPPQTSLFFALFGFFPFTISLVLFSLIQFIFLVLSGFEIKKIIIDDENSLLISFVFIFLIAGTWITMEYLAPNFLVVYLVLKSINLKSGIISGILLGIAALFRPLVLIFFLDLILRRRFKHIVGVVITIVSTSILSFFVFGPNTCMNYFINGPFTRVPVMSVYSNYTFCSLNAVLLRKNLITPIWGSPFFHPITLLYVGIIMLLILIVMIKRPSSYLSSISFLIPWAIFLYPETWWSYTVFLIFPIVNLYKNRAQLDSKWFFALAFPIYFLINDFLSVRPNGTVFGLFAFAITNSIWFLYTDQNQNNGKIDAHT